MKKSCGVYIFSHDYNGEGLGKFVVCLYHPFIMTWKDHEKLRYVYIITLLYHRGMRKSLTCIYY